jgi:hypothetical protein
MEREMHDIQFYKHATSRHQQRSIPMDVLEYIYDFGRWDYTSHGVEIAYLDKRGRKRFVETFSEKYSSRLGKFTHVYLILAQNGKVITVGYRYKRIRRKS